MATRFLCVLVICAVSLLGCTGQPTATPGETPARLERLRLQDTTFGRARTIRVWLPAGYDLMTAPLPILYLFDGQNLFDASLSDVSGVEWEVDETAARLILKGDLPPMIIVGIDHASDPGRAEEYIPYKETQFDGAPTTFNGDLLAAFFQNDVIKLIETRYLVDPDKRGVGGSSFGGVAALHLARVAPELFDRVLVESPSLWVANGQQIDDVANAPPAAWPERIYLGMGSHEGRDNCDAPRNEEPIEAVTRLADILGVQGLGPQRLKLNIGECHTHSETAWRDRFPTALTFLYGPAAGDPTIAPPAALGK